MSKANLQQSIGYLSVAQKPAVSAQDVSDIVFLCVKWKHNEGRERKNQRSKLTHNLIQVLSQEVPTKPKKENDDKEEEIESDQVEEEDA